MLKERKGPKLSKPSSWLRTLLQPNPLRKGVAVTVVLSSINLRYQSAHEQVRVTRRSPPRLLPVQQYPHPFFLPNPTPTPREQPRRASFHLSSLRQRKVPRSASLLILKHLPLKAHALCPSPRRRAKEPRQLCQSVEADNHRTDFLCLRCQSHQTS